MYTYYNNKFFKLHNFSNSSIHVAHHVHHAAAIEKGQFLQFLIHNKNSKNINKGQLILQEEERLIHYNLNRKNINKGQNLDHENYDLVKVYDPNRDEHADDDKIDDDILNLQNLPNHHIPLSQKLIPLKSKIYQIHQPWIFEV